MTIRDVQADWRVLDTPGFNAPQGIRLISHEHYDRIHTDGLLPVEEIKQGCLSRLFSFWNTLSLLIWAFQLLWRADARTVVIANGSTPLGNYVCLLNYYLFFNGRTILLWESHIEPRSRFKKYFARRCFLGCRLAALWSKRQPGNYAEQFDLSENLFVFIPYKANHSKVEPRNLPTLDYVFAGGNEKRDYKTLADAVRGTDVTLIISATLPSVREVIEDHPNVIPLAATEPSYAKLMAASRFVVIPLVSTGLKGAGEANFCNGMWHGKPVIAMDDISADDYITDGETGFIVPPGNVELLRQRILELWRDPEKCRSMGAKGRQVVRESFTDLLGIRRLVRLACLLGEERLNRT